MLITVYVIKYEIIEVMPVDIMNIESITWTVKYILKCFSY